MSKQQKTSKQRKEKPSFGSFLTWIDELQSLKIEELEPKKLEEIAHKMGFTKEAIASFSREKLIYEIKEERENYIDLYGDFLKGK